MNRTPMILVGGFQVMFAMLLATAVVRMASLGAPLLWQKAPAPLAIAGAAVVGAAIVACALNGIRMIADRRVLARWRWLPVVSGVAGCMTVAILVGDIVYTETRPMTGNAAFTALGRPAAIAFTALDGRQIDVAAAGKVTLVFCWATWCGPCKAKIPEIERLYRKWNARGFEVVAINFDEDRSVVEKFVKDRGLPWPQYFEGKSLRENSFAARYELTGIPQLWLVDKRGVVRDVEGYVDLTAKVGRLMAE